MEHRSRLPWAVIVAAIVLLLNSAVQWPFAVRFDYWPLNRWAIIILALAIPVAVVFLRRGSAGLLGRLATLFMFALLLVPVFLVSLLALLQQPFGRPQDSLAVGPFVYRVYEDHSGLVTNPPMTILRKELDTLLGIKLVRTMVATEVIGKAVLRQIDDSTLELEIDGYPFFRKRIAI